MSNIYIKTKSNKHNLVFFPANRLIVLNNEQRLINFYSKGNSTLLYQGDDAIDIYEDILNARKQFWTVFKDLNEKNIQERLKVLLEEFPYLTTKDVTTAKDCIIERSDLYLPLLPYACSRIQVEDGKEKELSEIIIKEEDKSYIYVCNKKTLEGLPYLNIDIYNQLLNTIDFFYMSNGLIKGITQKERVLFYPPIKDWYKYTPEIGNQWEGNNDVIMQLNTKDLSTSINIEEVDKIRQVLDKKLKEKFLREVQKLIEN